MIDTKLVKQVAANVLQICETLDGLAKERELVIADADKFRAAQHALRYALNNRGSNFDYDYWANELCVAAGLNVVNGGLKE